MLSCFVFVACETAHIVRYVLALEQTLTFSDARRAFLPPPAGRFEASQGKAYRSGSNIYWY